MIKLGDKVRDPITGFEGIATAKTEWLYGCTRLGVQAKMGEDGKVHDPHWFDEPQLEGIAPEDASVPGGPRPEPTRSIDPVR
jgi:hypothetical protein